MEIKIDLEKKTEAEKHLFCFVIMPFELLEFIDSSGNKNTLNKNDLDHLFESFIKKASESFSEDNIKIKTKRYSGKSGNFMKGIVNELYLADLVIADITGLNPNVMYELGIRHTLKDNTIMIAQDKTQIPSDLAQYIAVLYKYPQKASETEDSYKDFELKIHQAIKERLGKWKDSDNPVRDFIQIKRIFKDEERIREIVGNINVLNVLTGYIQGLISYINSCIEEWGKGIDKPLPPIDDNWEEFYISLLKQPNDFNTGKYILILNQSLGAIKNNLPLLYTKLKNKTGPDIIPIGFRSMDGTHYPMQNLKEKENPVMNDLKKIKANWEAELALLKK